MQGELYMGIRFPLITQAPLSELILKIQRFAPPFQAAKPEVAKGCFSLSLHSLHGCYRFARMVFNQNNVPALCLSKLLRKQNAPFRLRRCLISSARFLVSLIRFEALPSSFFSCATRFCSLMASSCYHESPTAPSVAHSISN